MNKKLVCFVALFIYLAIFGYLQSNLTMHSSHRLFYQAFIPERPRNLTCREKQTKQCLDLFASIGSYSMDLVHRPPLRYPPDDLLFEFTQYGQMPITNLIYYNEVYEDFLDESQQISKTIIRNKTINRWIKRANSSD